MLQDGRQEGSAGCGGGCSTAISIHTSSALSPVYVIESRRWIWLTLRLTSPNTKCFPKLHGFGRWFNDHALPFISSRLLIRSPSVTAHSTPACSATASKTLNTLHPTTLLTFCNPPLCRDASAIPPWDFISTARDGTPRSKSKNSAEGRRYNITRRKRGPKNSNWSGEYDKARVVHVKEKKTRFKDVLHDDSIGIANSEANGREMGARRDVSDIAQVVIDSGMIRAKCILKEYDAISSRLLAY
jgi:hypothetical protein